MTYLEFIRDKLGTNWVVARRTANIVRRYGEDVVCISQQRLRVIDKEYRALFGDPNDKVRAQMYLALLSARAALAVQFGREDSVENKAMMLCDAAIKAEQERS